MARGLKDICKDGKTIEIIKQYEAAKRFWLCSPGDDQELNRRRRAFVTAYSDSMEELYQAGYGKNLQTALTEKHQKDLSSLGIQELLEDYHWMKQDQKYQNALKAGNACTEKEWAEERKKELSGYTDREELKAEKSTWVPADPLDDPSITEEQRKSLKEFHKWLYRNCDKTGAQILGSDGTMRNLAEDFMSRPAREQLKALYLLETNKRKTPSEITNDDRAKLNAGSGDAYVPDLNHLKEKMIATKWKFWKRRNGSHLYWEKLQDALNQAGNKEHPVNKQMSPEDAKEFDAEESSFGDKFDEAVEKYGEIVDQNLVGRGLDQHANAVDLADKVFDKSYSGAMEGAAKWMGVTGAGLHIIGGVANMISDIRTLGSGVKVRAGEKIGQVGNLIADTADTASSSNDIVSYFLAEGTNIAKHVEFAGGVLGTVAGSVYVTNAIVGLVKHGNQYSNAKDAAETGKDIHDEFLEKTGMLRQRQIKKEAGSTALSFVEGAAWLGGGISALCAVSWALPAAGAAAMLVGVGRDIYDGVVNRKMYRDTADTYLFHEGKDLPALDADLKKKLETRKKLYPENSKEYQYLDELGRDSKTAMERRYDIIRRNKLKEEQCCSLRGYHQKAMDQVGEKILAKCFKDENGNLITNEQKKGIMKKKPDELKTQERVMIGYKDLAKSFGINTRMKSGSKLKDAQAQKEEETKIKERIREGMQR